MNSTLEVFHALKVVQSWACFFSVSLGGLALYFYGLSPEAIVPLLLSILVFPVCWWVPQIIHELVEINDQLAGRSPELHEHLKRNHRVY